MQNTRGVPIAVTATRIDMKLAIVAVPGSVIEGSDGGEVIAALGGNHAIAQLHRPEADIALNISVNANRGFIIAKQNIDGKPCALLVKVKRWSNGRRTVEIIGAATKIFTFNQPADFIHIANAPTMAGAEVGQNETNQLDDGLVPPFFTKINSIANLFKGNFLNAPQEKSGKINGSQMFNAVAHFDDDTIPTEPLQSNVLAPPDELLVAALENLFNQRPVWLRAAMDEHLPTTFSTWKKKVAFARTCYIFADGPWRGCMCKLGYDPRKHRSSRIYQIIDFRDTYYRTISWKTDKQANNRPEQVTESSTMAVDETYANAVANIPHFNPEVHFLAPPSRPSQLYQLCDIFDAAIQKLVNENDADNLMDYNPTCSKSTGWYSQSTLSKIRDMMNVKSLRMRQTRRAS
ncbi:General transcription factor 3C polypeptide 5 [Babesia sp. Xinjiang]|uniref:General transcription factor 3C polypeptide 5 n=1 Tax=Babesia sp. Xinjiang TaxID=462227 RepID=UPI000A2532FB|nr:General transcription factor 3C polypeptide 5 [Babesia sp. Xinjiang]ORM39792.1 General transcription factor 3C polypeptide 5 [Babesia sp. Xinjiang]